MLADAVKINDGIDNELKICGLLKMLQLMESGDFILEQVANSCNKLKYILKSYFIGKRYRARKLGSYSSFGINYCTSQTRAEGS